MYLCCRWRKNARICRVLISGGNKVGDLEAWLPDSDVLIVTRTPPEGWPGHNLEEVSARIKKMKVGNYIIIANRGDDFVFLLPYKSV